MTPEEQSPNETLPRDSGSRQASDEQVTVSLDPPSDNPASSARLQKLSSRATHARRYQLLGEVAHGGMGAILRVWDEDLHRHLAMKVILGQGDGASGERPAVPAEILQRFLDEAQISGQLDHPGVVPVHELGIDDHGKAYFTMRLVKGRDLKEIIELVHACREGWTRTRALEIIIKVCDTLAYAHAKNVIHRDLKPSNVMVGRYGEVYVMDWGLAKVLGQEDRRDIRIQSDNSRTEIKTDRSDDSSEGSPLVTMDGAVVGTPAYMPPEQGAGRIEELGPSSDVYSVGAMLYHLLAGHAPYLRPGDRISPRTLLARVLLGAPEPLDPSVPAELMAICEKAMARASDERYPRVSDLAADLRAYLDRRVVSAYRTGPIVEMKLWVRRNRGLAASVAMGLVTTLSMLVVAWILQVKSGEEVLRERDLAVKAIKNLLVRIGADALDDVPQVELLRDEILEDALVLYRELLERTPNDSRIRIDAARAYVRAADAREELGRQDGARQALQEALRLVEPLLEKEPADLAVKELAADCVVSLGDIAMRSVLHDRAEGLYMRGVTIRREILAERPDDLRSQVKVGFVRARLASVNEALGRDDAARAIFDEVLLEEEVLRRAPPDLREEVTLIYHRYGMMALKLGETDAAKTYLEKALAWQGAIVEADAERGRPRMNLAEIHRSCGHLYATLGRADDALRHYREPMQLLEQLTRDFPRITIYRNRFARALFSLGAEEHRRGHDDRAEVLYRRALEQHDRTLALQDGRPDYLGQRAQTAINLADVLGDQGDVDEAEELLEGAIATFADLAERFPNEPTQWVGLMTSCQKMSASHVEAGRMEKGIEYAEESVSHARQIVRLLPAVPKRRSSLGAALHNLAQLLDDERSIDLAFEAFEHQKVALKSLPNDPQVVRFLGNHIGLIVALLWDAGRLEEAAAYVDEYGKLRWDDGAAQWSASMMYAGTLQRLQPDDDAGRAEAIAGVAAALERGRELGYITAELVRTEGTFLERFRHHPEIRAALP